MSHELEEARARHQRAMHYLDQEKECSRLLREQRDKAWAELEEMKIQLKRLAPTGRYNGLQIEDWFKRAIAAEERLLKIGEAAGKLNAIRADIECVLYPNSGMATA